MHKNGNVAKLASQTAAAVNIAAVSETPIFAKKAGTAPELVCRAIRGGLAGFAGRFLWAVSLWNSYSA